MDLNQKPSLCQLLRYDDDMVLEGEGKKGQEGWHDWKAILGMARNQTASGGEHRVDGGCMSWMCCQAVQTTMMYAPAGMTR